MRISVCQSCCAFSKDEVKDVFPCICRDVVISEPLVICDEDEDSVETTKEESASPGHYKGDIECVEAMRQICSATEFAAHCRLTAFKYLWRAGEKGPAAIDYAKAEVYCRWAKEACKDE